MVLPERVTITVDNTVAQVRLNRPEKMNALDPAMFEAIAAAIASLRQMHALRAVVLAGEGASFCAGLDMASMATGDLNFDLTDRDADGALLVQRVAWGWRTLPVPVIAAAHGACLGGGFQIFSGADIRIARADTRCCIMESKWGLVPDMAGFALWRTTVRDDVLRELAYTARIFSGEHAYELGFVSHLSDHPLDKATEVAHEIASRNPDAVRGIKRLANLTAQTDAATILKAETAEQVAVIGHRNQIEAVNANLETRAAQFIDK